jgi:hypothetical protein
MTTKLSSEMDRPGAPTHPSAAQAGPAPFDKRQVARVVLVAFIVTFILARIVVLLIMTHHIPTLYLHLGGTHVHHLNYGIVLLSLVGAFLLFRRPDGRTLTLAALTYGVGLALTFDEFGMWVHLGGPYWQRASFDAMVVIGALLGLYCAAPTLRKFQPRQWTTAVLLLLGVLAFGTLLVDSLRYATDKLSPFFEQIEAGGPE